MKSEQDFTSAEVTLITKHAQEIYTHTLGALRASGTHTVDADDLEGMATSSIIAAQIFLATLRDMLQKTEKSRKEMTHHGRLPIQLHRLLPHAKGP